MFVQKREKECLFKEDDNSMYLCTRDRRNDNSPTWVKRICISRFGQENVFDKG